MLRMLLGAAALVIAHVGFAAAAEAPKPPAQQWSFGGLFGTFDRSAVRRGFEVYKTVCASCHSASLLYYRHLATVGFGQEEIKAIAAEVEVTDGPNDDGQMFERPGLPSDRFKAPFANAQAARAANNGALPPDLSLIVKARKGGADFVYALLTGYAEPPADFTMTEGMNYNAWFPGHQIAMPPPLAEGGVDYPDGTPATVDQYAYDVTTFLAWAASPEMEERKRLGVKVILFLLVLTGMLYALKRQIWLKAH